ncbi:hypothetical protein ACE5IS_01415 [Leptospira wolffii]|uniref:Lipoprotein n=1 Tax=Leptospira wolffii TaxID=409998 RepID=A0ABV5BJN7_9LEPT|nr:hypothetical protein [Leptospira wolffii]TGL49235.1 hypothetical protein EHQ61_12280 [Leptospira wolffii]
MSYGRLLILSFLLFGSLFWSQCYFAVDWSQGSGPNGKERATLEETPDPEESNLSKSELKRKGKAGKSNKDDQETFEILSGQSGSSARSCTVLYSNCKDKCWKEFPPPKVETVFTAVTVDRKRWDCVGKCRNVCDNFDPPSSGGSMPNSGKGNYSEPPR